MATFRLSRLAEAGLMDIGSYSLPTWGEDQTIRYLDELEVCGHQRMLPERPSIDD